MGAANLGFLSVFFYILWDLLVCCLGFIPGLLFCRLVWGWWFLVCIAGFWFRVAKILCDFGRGHYSLSV